MTVTFSVLTVQKFTKPFKEKSYKEEKNICIKFYEDFVFKRLFGVILKSTFHQSTLNSTMIHETRHENLTQKFNCRGTGKKSVDEKSVTVHERESEQTCPCICRCGCICNADLRGIGKSTFTKLSDPKLRNST